MMVSMVNRVLINPEENISHEVSAERRCTEEAGDTVIKSQHCRERSYIYISLTTHGLICMVRNASISLGKHAMNGLAFQSLN